MKSHYRHQQNRTFSPFSLTAQGRRIGAVVLSAIIVLTGVFGAFTTPALAQQCAPKPPCPTATNVGTTLDGRFRLTLTSLVYDFPNGTSTWTYRMQQLTSGPALSHFVIGICEAIGPGNVISSQSSCNGTTFTNQSFSINQDPTTTVFGIKFEPLPNACPNDFFVRFTLNLAVPATPARFGTKAGNQICFGCILAPGDADPSTPNSCDERTPPSAAKFDSFKATPMSDGRIRLAWRTGLEVDNLGFRVYREERGKRALVTPDIVAGSALLTGPDMALTAGQSYEWVDTLPGKARDVQYWLEDLDLNGKSTWNGPFTISEDIDSPSPLPGKGRSRLLSSLGVEATEASPASYNGPVEARAKLIPLSAEQLAGARDLAGESALKLSIKQEGWYRVTQPELVAAGLNAGVNPRDLQMFVDGQEIAIRVEGYEDGKFDAGDAVEFYGTGLDSAATDTRVYWLVAGKDGKRVGKAQAKGRRYIGASFPYTVERRDRTIYFSSLRNGETENFFGAVVLNRPVDQTVNVLHLDKASTATALLEVALQGVSESSHQVKVAINGIEVGQVAYEGISRGTARLSVSNEVLLEGQNTVTLTATGPGRDVNLVDYIRLTYQHTYTADNDALRVTVPGKRKVTVGGMSQAAMRVLDITSPADVTELAGKVEAQGAGFGVTFSAVKGDQRTVLIVGSDQFKRPVSITANQPSGLRDANREADLVIITPRDFIPSIEPLRAHRQSQGLAVAIVDIEDVYDEFSFGHKSPQAIRDFLAYARANWKRAPQYALFGGDASYDPKNYMGRGNNDFVPTRLVDTINMETASDDWMADFDGDSVADMSIGRLPVRTAFEMAAMVAKIIGYDGAEGGEGVVLVADRNDTFNFEAASAQIRSLVPEGVGVEEIRRSQADDAVIKNDVLRAVNRGPEVVIYTGHGSVNLWRGNLLTASDVQQLSNGQKLPLFVTMTCLNGYFHDPVLEGLAESLMKAPTGGAIAVWASSGMTDPAEQAFMSQQLFGLLYGGSAQALTLGEATARAKATARSEEVRQTWILFGDPTTRLR